MSRWVYFEAMAPAPKTQRWQVRAKDGGFVLGTVKWFGRWRRYAFFPEADTIFEQDCLRDIATFITNQTSNYRAQKKESM